MTQSFIFHTQNKGFNDRFISIVLYRKVLQRTLYFTFLTNQQWNLLTNMMIDMHIDVPPTMREGVPHST